MNTFLCVVVALGALEVIGGLLFLKDGQAPQRTRGSLAWNVFCWVCLCSWALVLLFRSSP